MKRLLVILLFLLLASMTDAQVIATIEVQFSGPSNDLIVPVKIDLSSVTELPYDQLSLNVLRGKKREAVSFQISSENGSRFLHWIAEPKSGVQKIEFQLRRGKPAVSSSLMKLSKENGGLTLNGNSKNLLRYQFARLDPPAGVDPSYGRSGFIHPLWSPGGQVLTRIQPPDHYHHYGIWNPWTHVLYEGDTIDFWNLNKKEATVRFAKFLDSSEGAIFSEYRALQEHVVLKEGNGEKVALNEIQHVRIYQPSERNYYFADIDIDMACASESPFLILAYRYAGLGWRTTEKWDNKNSEVLTSDYKTRKDADGTTARWCLVQGAIDDDHAGVLMMSNPANYNHPEPLRIWPENQYGRGDMFANFSPTKNKDWPLLPGQKYSLRYRLVVFNGKFDAVQSEAAWHYFANPPSTKVIKH
jgi:hypothetical protein